jgi:hypothetical protein
MSGFITTSDGRIAFKKDEFKLMTAGDPNIMRDCYEITLWTASYPGGRIIKFPTKLDRDRAAKEITAQLTSPPNLEGEKNG